ncbi:hypothetical protein D3C80_1384410 [compost metagenome]
MTIGTCKTPAALIVSKKTPSEVLAFPIVPHAISFPSIEKLDAFFMPVTFLYIFEACASPNKRGICPAVGEMSALEFFCSVRFFQEPSSFKLCVAKWPPICLPADIGSLSISVCPYNPAKNCSMVNLPIAIINV